MLPRHPLEGSSLSVAFFPTASLKGETLNIQADISRLLQDMNGAIAQADSFISTLR
jgi:hypothetical protein